MSGTTHDDMTEMGERGMSRRRFLKVAGLVGVTVAIGGGGYAAATWAPRESEELLRETMGEGMSKVLVVYGTKSGCTAGVAARIGETLAEEGLTVEVVPAEDRPDPSGYDAVVVGSGIRVAQWHGAAKEWVLDNAAALKARPVAFYTCCLTVATDAEDAGKMEEVRAYTDPLIEESGVTPVELGLFAGWNEAKRFSLPERLILKALKAPKGDFRDMDAIAEWTRGAAGKLGVA